MKKLTFYIHGGSVSLEEAVVEWQGGATHSGTVRIGRGSVGVHHLNFIWVCCLSNRLVCPGIEAAS